MKKLMCVIIFLLLSMNANADDFESINLKKYSNGYNYYTKFYHSNGAHFRFLDGDLKLGGISGTEDVDLYFDSSNDGQIRWDTSADQFWIPDDILLSGGTTLYLRDSGLFLKSSTDGQVDLNADSEIELTAPSLDLNASTGFHLSSVTATIVATLSVTGNTGIVGNTGITGTFSVTGASSFGSTLEVTGETTLLDKVFFQHAETGTDAAWGGIYTGAAYSDETDAFDSTDATDETLLPDDDDFFLIAHTYKFDGLKITLQTAGSTDAGLAFYYGDGASGWTSFTPTDGTSGLTASGEITWDASALTSWGTDTVNDLTGLTGTTDYYWVKIARTTDTISTDAIEDTVLILTDESEYIDSETDGYLDLHGGDGVIIHGGTDVYLKLSGPTSTGVLMWDDSLDKLQVNDTVLMQTTRALQFRDTGISIRSNDDGHLDLTADTQIDLNGDTRSQSGFFGLGAATEVTIASGVITATKSYHDVDTEGDAANDDLDTISGGSEGDILVLGLRNAGRLVTAKDGTGNLRLGADRAFGDGRDVLTLIKDASGDWHEISWADN